ncbi:MAG: DUF5343 domain-containing protein [Pseudomonadota bacterium]
MPTTNRYLTSAKNLKDIFNKAQHGVPPEKFNNDHLKAIGFASSNDRAVVPLMKDLGFLTGDGTPTQRYRDYRDPARSRAVMAQALREAYPDLFVINEKLSKSDREAVKGRFKSLHDSSESVAEAQTKTFYALLELADLSAPANGAATNKALEEIVTDSKASGDKEATGVGLRSLPLNYRFEIQLPATKDVEVFRAIFKALREELING